MLLLPGIGEYLSEIKNKKMNKFYTLLVLLLSLSIISCGKKNNANSIKLDGSDSTEATDYLGKYSYINVAKHERIFEIKIDSANNIIRQDFGKDDKPTQKLTQLQKLNESSIEAFVGKENTDKVSWALGNDKYIIVKITDQIVVKARNGNNLLTSEYALITKSGAFSVKKVNN